MSNPDFSQFGLYTSSLIAMIEYLIALKKEKNRESNTKEKNEHSRTFSAAKKTPNFFFFEYKQHKACQSVVFLPR